MNIWWNIGVILIVIALFIIFKRLLDKLFIQYLMPISENFGKKIGNNIQKRSTIFAIEVIVLLLVASFVTGHITLYIITGGKGLFFFYWIIMMVFFVATILILSAVIQQYKFKNPEYTSHIGKLIKELNNIGTKLKDNYFSNRLGLFIEQTPDFFKSLIILQVSLTCLVTLKWSPNFYFLSICFMPLYANYWVYYVKVLTVNTNTDGVFIRRSFMYLCLIVVVIFELYLRFEAYLKEIQYSPSIDVFLLTGSGVLYIALDRILKDFTNDYLKFRKEVGKPKATDSVGDFSI